jgi:plasmid maintenance system antidote protein VapI
MKKMKTKTNYPGKIIYKQMIEAGLTIKELAYLIDKSYAVVYYIVRSRQNRLMTLDFAQRCAVIFGVDPSLYLYDQIDFELENNPLPKICKKNIINRRKYLQKIKSKQNKPHGGRKWTID